MGSAASVTATPKITEAQRVAAMGELATCLAKNWSVLGDGVDKLVSPEFLKRLSTIEGSALDANQARGRVVPAVVIALSSLKNRGSAVAWNDSFDHPRGTPYDKLMSNLPTRTFEVYERFCKIYQNTCVLVASDKWTEFTAYVGEIWPTYTALRYETFDEWHPVWLDLVKESSTQMKEYEVGLIGSYKTLQGHSAWPTIKVFATPKDVEFDLLQKVSTTPAWLQDQWESDEWGACKDGSGGMGPILGAVAGKYQGTFALWVTIKFLLDAGKAESGGYNATMEALVADFNKGCEKGEGAEFFVAPIKKWVRYFDKSMEYKEEGDCTNSESARRVIDVVRSSVVFSSPTSLAEGLKMFTERLDIVRVKNRFVPKNIPYGYRDILLNIRLPSGYIAEVQCSIANFFEVRKHMHPHYNVVRAGVSDPHLALEQYGLGYF